MLDIPAADVARIVVEGTRRGAPVQFTSTVDFPDRDRQNAFVARLWAAQRVGFLSAEKRRNGGAREVDEEIRMLGERYGIPTEFTSYLVVEPRLAVMRDRSAFGGGYGAGKRSGARDVGGRRAIAALRVRQSGVGSASGEHSGGARLDVGGGHRRPRLEARLANVPRRRG